MAVEFLPGQSLGRPETLRHSDAFLVLNSSWFWAPSTWPLGRGAALGQCLSRRRGQNGAPSHQWSNPHLSAGTG